MTTLGGGDGGTCMKLFECIFLKYRSILLTLLSTIAGGGAETHSSKSIRKSQLAWTRKTRLNRSLLF